MANVFGWLIAFKLRKGLTARQRTAFFRTLYGYADYSQYGKYRYDRLGSLDKRKIRYYSPIRGVVIIREKDLPRVRPIFRGKALVYIWKVVLTVSDLKMFGAKQ